MRLLLVGIVLAAACGRGHHDPIELTDAMRAQLTSISPVCVQKRGDTWCRSLDGVWAYLLMRDGKLWGVTYQLENMSHDAAVAKLHKVLDGLVDDELVAGIVAALETGVDAIDRNDVRAHVFHSTNSYFIDLRWTYL